VPALSWVRRATNDAGRSISGRQQLNFYLRLATNQGEPTAEETYKCRNSSTERPVYRINLRIPPREFSFFAVVE
jgi:hypothetical protein